MLNLYNPVMSKQSFAAGKTVYFSFNTILISNRMNDRKVVLAVMFSSKFYSNLVLWSNAEFIISVLWDPIAGQAKLQVETPQLFDAVRVTLPPTNCTIKQDGRTFALYVYNKCWPAWKRLIRNISSWCLATYTYIYIFTMFTAQPKKMQFSCKRVKFSRTNLKPVRVFFFSPRFQHPSSKHTSSNTHTHMHARARANTNKRRHTLRALLHRSLISNTPPTA